MSYNTARRNKAKANNSGLLENAFNDLSIEDTTSRDTTHHHHHHQQQQQQQPQRQRQQQQQSYTSDEVRREGLLICGFTRKRQDKVKQERNETRFRGNFGASSLAIKKVIDDLLDENLTKNFNLKYFFLTLTWLKSYSTYLQLEGHWDICPETIAAKSKEYLSYIHNLKRRKIKWFEDDEIEDDVFIMTVDGVHCRVQEVRKDPGSKWYSHKSHGAGLSYELGIAIRSDRLVWINGPFPASKHDITIFKFGSGDRNSPGTNLKSMIPVGKRVVADSGYSGEDNNTISVTREGDSKEVKEMKARAKSRHETFNSRIKSFTILSTEFRHNIALHQAVMESVCVLLQYDMESGHGLFEV